MSQKRFLNATEGYGPVKVHTPSGEKTKYAYQGEWYRLEAAGLTCRKARLVTLALSLCGLMGVVAAALVPSALNHTFYAGGFLFLTIVPLLFSAVGAVKLQLIPDWLTVQQYRECRGAVYYGALLAAVLSVAFLTGSAGYYLSGQPFASEDLLLLLTAPAVVAAQIFLVRMHREENYRISVERR